MKQYLFDLGLNWEELTFFNNFDYSLEKESYIFSIENFINYSNTYFTIKSYNSFKKNFYFYLSLNENNKNFKNSGIGYKNEWISIQFGEGVQNLGAGDKIELAMSSNSDPFNFLKISSNYGNLRVYYLHSFLENLFDEINRYLVAKGIEWTNKKNLVFGFSETSIYSGINRVFDIAYLNPINSHLEIELNNRLNDNSIGNTNAVWQIHSDIFLEDAFRVSINFLIDELVLDPDVEVGKENGIAYSVRLLHSYKKNKSFSFSTYFQSIKVGSSTFRHGNGYNNFINKGKPLGWEKGSDSQENSVGLVFSNQSSILLKILYGELISGEENILKNSYLPYQDYLKGSFPSGKVEKSNFLKLEGRFLLNRIYIYSEWSLNSNKKNFFQIGTGIYL